MFDRMDNTMIAVSRVHSAASDPAAPHATEICGRPVATFGRWLLLLVIVNLLARLPLCWDAATVTPDGAEYLAIARSLRTIGEYATDLKWQFYTDDPVRHFAWADRPPLYPVFAALSGAALPFLQPAAAARLGNAVLACLALVLGALYLRRLYGERVALLAAGFVFLLPHTLFWTTQPLTESLSLLLALGALLAWGQVFRCSGVQVFRLPAPALAGALAGVVYLVRPTGALLVVVFVLDALRQGKSARGRMPWLVGGFLLFALPYHLLLWRIYGSPFHSALGYTFAVSSVLDVTVYGFERDHPGALEFIRDHAAELPGLIGRQAWAHAQGLLLPLIALLPFAFRMRRSDWSGPRWSAGALILLTLFVHTAAWSARGSSRYFILCILLLAGALLAAGERSRLLPAGPGARPKGRLFPAACLLSAVGLAAALAQFYATHARADRGVPSLPAFRAAAEEVRGAALAASDNPWSLNLLGEVPAVMLPRTSDPAVLERFIAKYRPEALVLFADEPAEAPMREAWRGGTMPRGWRLARDSGTWLLARPVKDDDYD
jgi:hypothetical protein